MSRANPGRVAASRALAESEGGAMAEDALARNAPPGRDGALARFLLLGTLRRRGTVDAALRATLSQPLGGLDRGLRAVLRIATFEALFGRSPRHVVVSQGVEVCKALKLGRGKGLANAVLRRVELPRELSRADAVELPPWLQERWDTRYGIEATTRWAERLREAAPLSLVAKSGLVSDLPAGAVPASVGGTAVDGVGWLAAHGRVEELPGYREGAWFVADPAAMVVADLVPGGRVLDACAAPGGKSLRLVSRGASVLAVDKDEARTGRLRENADRCGLRLETRVHDWTGGPVSDLGELDAVLVDAPCSGLGTTRRHPDIRWRRTPRDLAGTAELQRRILDAASTHVRPGGMLVYAVCSPEPEEGIEVVGTFVAARPQFSQVRSFSSAPPAGDEDAHFAAVLVRRDSG